jgi:hypothetical protein
MSMPPTDRPPDRPGGPQPSLLRRWLGWLFGHGAGETAADSFFTALGQGRTAPPGPPVVLGPKRSRRPPSPLADAYNRPAAPQPEPPAAAPAAQWQVLEPPDGSDSVPHQQWQQVRCNATWTLLAASVRGRLHAHQALWRDDAFAWAAAGEWTCLAVADGAGSAPLARVGARLASEEGARSLAAVLAGWRPQPGADGVPTQEDLHRLRAALTGAARQARDAIDAEAGKRGCPARDFSTTCLLLAHIPFAGADLVGALQVGDGAIGLYTGSGACRVLGEADHGAYSSETRFLTTPGIDEELEQRTAFALPQGLLALAMMTDGVADDFFPEAERLLALFEGDPALDLETPQGRPLRGVLYDALADPRQGEALAEWLQYQKRGSSDDRTLLLLYRPGAAKANRDTP